MKNAILFASIFLSTLSSCDFTDEETPEEESDYPYPYYVCYDGSYETKEVCNNCDLTIDWSGLEATDTTGAEVDTNSIYQVLVYKLSLSAETVYSYSCVDDDSKSLYENILSSEVYETLGDTSAIVPVSVDGADESLLIVIGGESFTQYVYISPSEESSNTTLSL